MERRQVYGKHRGMVTNTDILLGSAEYVLKYHQYMAMRSLDGLFHVCRLQIRIERFSIFLQWALQSGLNLKVET